MKRKNNWIFFVRTFREKNYRKDLGGGFFSNIFSNRFGYSPKIPGQVDFLKVPL